MPPSFSRRATGGLLARCGDHTPVKKSIIITDLTRMQEGRVCIAGYDEEGNCIRPVLPPPGIHERSLYSQGRPIVFPFALVEYDLLHPHSQPPHTEDYRYNPNSVK